MEFPQLHRKDCENASNAKQKVLEATFPGDAFVLWVIVSEVGDIMLSVLPGE